MAQSHVIRASKKALAEMTTVYQSNHLNRTVPCTIFMAKIGTTTITAYQSGKIMLRGPQAEKEATRWEETSTTPQKKASVQTATPPADFGNWSVIGSGKAGNGNYSDPVTVCAAYVDRSVINKLKALGVHDSKELIDPQIIQSPHVIKELIPYKLLIVEPKKYNEIQPDYNVVHMRVALHNQTVCLLLWELAPTKSGGILVGQFTLENNYRKHVRNEKNQATERLFFVTKGEQYHAAVTATSITNHTTFLEELDKESTELGFSVPSDAGGESDQAAARILKKGGLDLLANYAKLHFVDTQKAQKSL